MDDAELMHTVGIDIGTSTTKLVFSELRVVNVAGRTRAPKHEITSRRLLYRSPLFRTPLHSEQLIDIEGVWGIVLQTYDAAGFSMEEVDSGAIIITGETATKENAREMLSTLSHRAGDFVVATAGPDLEGILAGKGSGAWEMSKNLGITVANIDIGGGTANVVMFRRGQVLGTCTLNIGGRMICFDRGRVVRIAKPLQRWLKNSQIELSVGVSVRDVDQEIHQVSGEMARILHNTLLGHFGNAEHIFLVGESRSWAYLPEAVVFSGGVGGMVDWAHDCGKMAEPNSFQTLLGERSIAGDGFADFGVLLAHGILSSAELGEFRRLQAEDTMRATVIGAGTRSLEISGATIHVAADLLPIQNVPVIACSFPAGESMAEAFRKVIDFADTVYDPQQEGQTYAFYLCGIATWEFSQFRQLASAFREVLDAKGRIDQPLVVIVDGDAGKALGMCLAAQKMSQVICIDQIQVEHGDYIDIGLPIRKGEAVPIVIKTLVLGIPKGEMVQ